MKDERLLLGAKTMKIAENAIKNSSMDWNLSMDVHQIKELLLDKNVVEVERISTIRNGQVSPNGLTFNRKPLPESITIRYMRF
jgi:hypothetical protein